MKSFQEYIKEEDNTKSVIGSGIADVFTDKHIDTLGIIVGKKIQQVYVAKDIEDGVKRYNPKTPPVLVIKGPANVLWAKPITKDGKLVNGMSSGSFIYTSNNVVMKNYSHPIRLMDRVE